MRPICADKLIRQLCLVSPDCDEFGRGVATGISTAIQKTADTPTLTLDDLRPKGRWVEKEESLGWNKVDVAECSICEESWVLGEYSFEDLVGLYMFCPNCGADMRGGGEDG